MTKAIPFQTDWLSKTLAGLLLGLFLSLACSAVFMQLPLNIAMSVKVQLAMWSVAPIWLFVLSLCFLFPTGQRAWLWLGLANLLVVVIYGLLRFF
ncbi:hypothetical protein A9Q78_05280 [Methylophaga sp. 41_12_T18]|nr:hypothetical protein A9Q78_05280 [Methylophaga sp. 41_12_T18]